MFLGPLKALRRDPPVIYLVLRPWQNLVGIEAGLLLGGMLLLIGFSGWRGGRWALVGIPFCLAMVVTGIVRLCYRHRVRVDDQGVYREQITPGTRLQETWPAADVTAVHVVPVAPMGGWRYRHWLTGVALLFRNGDRWLLTAGRRAWRERHLARSLAIIVGAPLWDRTIHGTATQAAQPVRALVGPGASEDALPPDDPCLTVEDTVPRRLRIAGPSAQHNAWVEELELGIDQVLIRRRAPWGMVTQSVPWRAVSVLGRSAGQGGLLIAFGNRQLIVGACLQDQTVDWLVARLQAYLPY